VSPPQGFPYRILVISLDNPTFLREPSEDLQRKPLEVFGRTPVGDLLGNWEALQSVPLGREDIRRRLCRVLIGNLAGLPIGGFRFLKCYRFFFRPYSMKSMKSTIRNIIQSII